MLDELDTELECIKRSNLFRTLKRVSPHRSSRIIIDGREYISLCSNNYLGLADHPALKEASIAAIQGYGTSVAASRLVSGNTELHERLEEITATLKGAEAALLFNSGYMANIGLLQAIAGEGDAIFSDSANHASIIDGCRLSRAKVFIYHHRDAEHLRSLLSGVSGYRRKIVITESIFSMNGDIAPLPEIFKTAEEHEAILVVDDAHATGVLGKRGRGSLEHFAIQADNIIQVGTYGKALGSFGAYISCPREVRDYLINRARTFIYTTALPVSIIAASIAAIKILEEDHERLRRLWENTRLFKRGLMNLGFDTLDSESPIIPVLIGEVEKTVRFSERLYEHGIYAVPIRPPTVPEGSSRIRTIVTACHSDRDIGFSLEKFEKIGKELRII